MGDINYHKITWTPALDISLPLHCREFIQATTSYGLSQLNQNPSHSENTNILDLILTNFPDKLSKIYSNIFHYTSDHFLLHFDLNTEIESIVQPKRTVLNFKRANFEQLKTDITNQNLPNRIDTECNIDNKLHMWLTALKAIISNNIPKITLKREHSAPWIDFEVIKALRKKDSALRTAKKVDTTNKWDKFKQLRNRLKNLITNKHRAFLSTICDTIFINPKRFWSFIKSKIKSSGLPTFLYHSDGTKEDNYQGMSNLFNKFFQTTFTPISTKPLPNITMHIDPNLSTVNLTEDEI